MTNIQRTALFALLLTVNGAWAHDHAAHQATAPEQTQQEQKDWGIAGNAKDVKRTITLTMNDKMRFTPDHIDVKQGETVRLRVRNTGKLMHELVLGTPKELQAHAAMMQKHPGMEHDQPDMAHVTPGKTGQIVWTFNRAGEFEFACLIDGHYQVGMKGTVRVAATPQQKAATSQAQPHTAHHGMAAAAPYAGQQQREIKALSPEDMQAYAQGQGFGFAKAAELNAYPGPMHVLELANELGLSEEQRNQTQTLLTQHKADVRRLGAELIEAERALDQAFANRTIDADSLTRLTRAAGEKLVQVRAAHLQTHLAQTALLTPQQIERYKTLRGYDGTDHMNHQQMQHGQHQH